MNHYDKFEILFFGETDFKFRFTSLRNGLHKLFREKIENIWETEYEFRFIKLWNGFYNPFQEKNFDFFWNGLQNPFHNFMKRNSYSVSQIFSIFSRTGLRILFQIGVKRMPECLS